MPQVSVWCCHLDVASLPSTVSASSSCLETGSASFVQGGLVYGGGQCYAYYYYALCNYYRVFFLAIYEEDAQHLKQVFPHEWHDISVKCRVSCVTDVYNQVPEPYYLSVTEVFRYT